MNVFVLQKVVSRSKSSPSKAVSGKKTKGSASTRTQKPPCCTSKKEAKHTSASTGMQKPPTHAGKKAPQQSPLNVSETDPFIGKLVGFSCNSDVKQMLITSFDSKWVAEAICKAVD